MLMRVEARDGRFAPLNAHRSSRVAAHAVLLEQFELAKAPAEGGGSGADESSVMLNIKHVRVSLPKDYVHKSINLATLAKNTPCIHENELKTQRESKNDKRSKLHPVRRRSQLTRAPTVFDSGSRGRV